MRCFSAALLVSLFLAAPVSAQPSSDTASVPLDTWLGPFRSVTLTVGGDSARFLFDTGGGVTVLDEAFAGEVGCRPWGRIVGFRAGGDRVDLERCPALPIMMRGVPLDASDLAVWDLQGFLDRVLPGIERPPVDGVLSLKTLAARPFTLRLAERRLTLETERSFRRQIADMHPLRSRLATGPDGDELTVFVRGAVSDTGWFLVDSGNLDLVQTGPHLRPRSADSAETWEAVLTLEGLPGIPTEFRTREIIYDGVLSEEFLRYWVLAFDLSTNGVWASAVR